MRPKKRGVGGETKKQQPENKRGHCTDRQSLEQGRNLEVKQTTQEDVPRDKELFGQMPRQIKARE